MCNNLKSQLLDWPRERIISSLETLQDFIAILLCVSLFTAMLIRVGELFFSLVHQVQFQLVTADILFVLILLELFRLLIIYLQKRQISVVLAVEVSIVSILREVIVRGILDIPETEIIAVGIMLLILGGMLLIPILEGNIPQKIEETRETKQILEAVPVGVFVTDVNGQPYYANQTAQQILGKGITKAAMREQLTEIYQAYLAGTESLYPEEKVPIRRALKGETAIVDDMEIRHNNKTISLEVSATPVYNEKEEITYALAAFKDISDRKQAEVERIELSKKLECKNAQLEKAQKELAKTIQELEETNRTLEQKVQERTKELSQTINILKVTQADLDKDSVQSYLNKKAVT